MPGVASLDAQQYYAHPRNAFWWITAQLFGFDPELDYPQRCQALIGSGVAVWDVLRSCVRPGSLDSSIDPASVVANDFAGLLQQQPSIRRIYFNGAAAAAAWKRHVSPVLTAAEIESPPCLRLPSTSPAYAALTRQDKLQAWREIVNMQHPVETHLEAVAQQ